MSPDPVVALRARLSVRIGLDERARASLEALRVAADEALGAAKAADGLAQRYAESPDEEGRLALRSSAATLREIDARFVEALARVGEHVGDLKKTSDAVAQSSKLLVDPARVAAASAKTALETLPKATAERWARGDLTFESIEKFIVAVCTSHEASTYMRSEGAACRDVSGVLFWLPLLEQLASLNHGAPGRLESADTFPSKLNVSTVRTFVESLASSEVSSPAAVANYRGKLAQIRAAAQAGCRTLHDISEFEELQTPRRNLHAPERPIAVRGDVALGDLGPIEITNVQRPPRKVSTPDPEQDVPQESLTAAMQNAPAYVHPKPRR
jgi:hypothetical protein